MYSQHCFKTIDSDLNNYVSIPDCLIDIEYIGTPVA